MRRSRRFSLVALIVLLAVLYVFAHWWASRSQRLESVTARGQSSESISLFYALKNKADPDSMNLRFHPILDEKELGDFKSLFILSPLQSISAREMKMIKDFVQSGGLLVLSFHDPVSELIVRSIESALGLQYRINKNLEFKNHQTMPVQFDGQSEFFRKGETYEFYSPFVLEGCPPTPDLSCFFLEQPLGKGRVLLQSGLPLFSNALILRSDNRKFAFRLLNELGKTSVDEYRHFFSDKTVGDLLKEPVFSLPLFGFFLLLILSFIFGHSSADLEPEKRSLRSPSISFHELNERILLSAFNSPASYREALKGQSKILRHLFPANVREIQSQLEEPNSQTPMTGTQFLKRAARLVSFHRQILKRKGVL